MIPAIVPPPAPSRVSKQALDILASKGNIVMFQLPFQPLVVAAVPVQPTVNDSECLTNVFMLCLYSGHVGMMITIV